MLDQQRERHKLLATAKRCFPTRQLAVRNDHPGRIQRAQHERADTLHPGRLEHQSEVRVRRRIRDNLEVRVRPGGRPQQSYVNAGRDAGLGQLPTHTEPCGTSGWPSFLTVT